MKSKKYPISQWLKKKVGGGGGGMERSIKTKSVCVCARVLWGVGGGGGGGGVLINERKTGVGWISIIIIHHFFLCQRICDQSLVEFTKRQ